MFTPDSQSHEVITNYSLTTNNVEVHDEKAKLSQQGLQEEDINGLQDSTTFY